MRDQGYGRVINTTSAAGLYGNFGQCNYRWVRRALTRRADHILHSAAKMALVGFTTALAKEGASKNVFANAIAPLAGSRMTATVMPPEVR
jgi:multifunctional beta-oxidation protein